MQPNKSVEEIVKEFEEKLRSGYFHIEGTGGLKVELTKDFLRQALTSHTNTVLQGVVERVEKQKKEWSIISEKADTVFMTGKPMEYYSLEQAHHDAGYYGNKAEALDTVLSLLNDQIISNEEKK